MGRKVLNTQFCHIVLFSDDRSELRYEAVAGRWRDEEKGRQVPVEPERSHAAFTIHTGQPQMFEDIRKWDDFKILDDARCKYGIVSGLSVPIYGATSDEIRGAMIVNTTFPRKYSLFEVNVLGILANNVTRHLASQQVTGTGVESRRGLYQEAVKRGAIALAEASARGSLKDLYDPLIEETVKALQGLVEGLSFGAIYRYYSDREELELVATYCVDAETSPKLRRGHRRSLRNPKRENAGIVGRAVLGRKTEVVGDTSADSDYVENHESTNCEISIPLMSGERVLGAVSIQSKTENAFDEEARRAVEELSNLMVVFIVNHSCPN